MPLTSEVTTREPVVQAKHSLNLRHSVLEADTVNQAQMFTEFLTISFLRCFPWVLIGVIS